MKGVKVTPVQSPDPQSPIKRAPIQMSDLDAISGAGQDMSQPSFLDQMQGGSVGALPGILRALYLATQSRDSGKATNLK